MEIRSCMRVCASVCAYVCPTDVNNGATCSVHVWPLSKGFFSDCGPI